MANYIALSSSIMAILFFIMWSSVCQRAKHLANNSIPTTEYHKQLSKYYEMGYQRGVQDANKQNNENEELTALVNQPTAESVNAPEPGGRT